ncbi:MAG: hypothetical protein FRX49_05106 [Trebouxia sp. A1-2]|nr:MAG: hypothetical protein FRX49_05106 [Trebouxia sp. A1-2]
MTDLISPCKNCPEINRDEHSVKSQGSPLLWACSSRAEKSELHIPTSQQVDQKLSAALQQRYEMKQQALGRG